MHASNPILILTNCLSIKGGEFIKSFTNDKRMFVIFNEDKVIDESTLNSAPHGLFPQVSFSFSTFLTKNRS